MPLLASKPTKSSDKAEAQFGLCTLSKGMPRIARSCARYIQDCASSIAKHNPF